MKKNIIAASLFATAIIALASLTGCASSVDPEPQPTDEKERIEHESSPLRKDTGPGGSCPTGETYCCTACQGGGRICMCVASCPLDMPLC